jgi:hypothetical protein
MRNHTGRPFLPATDTRCRTFARTHGDVDAFVIGTEAGVLIDKAPEMMATV